MSDIPTRDQLESHTVMQKVRCLDAKLDKAIEAGTVGIIYKAGEGINITDDDIIENADHDNLIAVQASVATKQNHLTTAQLNACNSGITSTKVSAYDAYASGKQDKLTSAQLNACNSGITSAKVSTYDGYATSKQGKLTAGTGITISSSNVISATGTGGATSGYWQLVTDYTSFAIGDIIMVGLAIENDEPMPSSWQTAPTSITQSLNPLTTTPQGLAFITLQMTQTSNANEIGSWNMNIFSQSIFASDTTTLVAHIETDIHINYNTSENRFHAQMNTMILNGGGVAWDSGDYTLTSANSIVYRLVQ